MTTSKLKFSLPHKPPTAAPCRALHPRARVDRHVRASHILIKHQDSSRKASWKDPEGRVISTATRDFAASVMTSFPTRLSSTRLPLATLIATPLNTTVISVSLLPLIAVQMLLRAFTDPEVFESVAAAASKLVQPISVKISFGGRELAINLLEKNKDLHFDLLSLHFVELVCSRKCTEALEFAKMKLTPFGKEQKYVEKLQDFIALLAYEKPEKSPMFHLLTLEYRQHVAESNSWYD
ncbi:hypothetical protein V6N13_097534 [Hibiscus sabdariffa]|uniref:CTLH domain-containing protein n=1 Tax=Hibiscus sabdariffa TaxID=183260 RepID=A0ABR2PCY7_9ROSI